MANANPITDCPLARAGVEIAGILDRINAAEDEETRLRHSVETHALNTTVLELLDKLDAVQLAATFTNPSSLTGVAVHLVLMSVYAGDMEDLDPTDTAAFDRLTRRIRRTAHASVQYLADQHGVDVSALRRHYLRPETDYTATERNVL